MRIFILSLIIGLAGCGGGDQVASALDTYRNLEATFGIYSEQSTAYWNDNKELILLEL